MDNIFDLEFISIYKICINIDKCSSNIKIVQNDIGS